MQTVLSQTECASREPSSDRAAFATVSVPAGHGAGDANHPGGVAVVILNGDSEIKRMKVASPNTQFSDVTGRVEVPVTTDADGWAE